MLVSWPNRTRSFHVYAGDLMLRVLKLEIVDTGEEKRDTV